MQQNFTVFNALTALCTGSARSAAAAGPDVGDGRCELAGHLTWCTAFLGKTASAGPALFIINSKSQPEEE